MNSLFFFFLVAARVFGFLPRWRQKPRWNWSSPGWAPDWRSHPELEAGAEEAAKHLVWRWTGHLGRHSVNVAKPLITNGNEKLFNAQVKLLLLAPTTISSWLSWSSNWKKVRWWSEYSSNFYRYWSPFKTLGDLWKSESETCSGWLL